MLCIGKVLKSNGTDGELLVSFLEIAPGDIDLQEPVFIKFDGLPVPFYFESFRQRGNSRALVRFVGIRNLTDADELAGRAIHADYFQEDKQEDFIGWTVLDQNHEAVGEVTRLEDIPGNTCLRVRKADNTAVLLPFHEDLMKGADPQKQLLVLEIPQGVLDL